MVKRREEQGISKSTTSLSQDNEEFITYIPYRHGHPCTSGCSGDKFLVNFTLVGIGTDSQWLDVSSLSIQPYCWWFIAPGLPTPITASELPPFLFQIKRPIHNDTSSALAPGSGDFNITLQFNSIYPSNSLHCCSESVLIYDGLPDFILPIGYQNITQSPISTPEELSSLESSSVPNMGKLLAAFTGMELNSAHLSVPSSFLTVVYHYSDHFRFRRGFNAAVTVGVWQGEELLGAEEEEAWELDTNTLQVSKQVVFDI